MNFCCYIIYSLCLDRFYIGETENFEQRLKWHNQSEFKKAFTSSANDWEEYLIIKCDNRVTARRIEKYLKQMKSRKFLISLKQNPEKLSDILTQYSLGNYH